MVPYTRLRNSTCVTTANNYYDSTDTSATNDYCGYGYYDGYSQTPTKEEKKIVIPKERQIFNRNKISNINIKLKQQILPVRQQMRFTTRNAL